MKVRAIGLAAVLSLFVSACIGTPPELEAQNVLGGDVEEEGPLHRPGQPCLACHNGSVVFGSGPAFTVAGTVYASALDATGRRGVTVRITDFRGREELVPSNVAGNFYTKADLVFPIRVRVEDSSIPACHDMQTRVLRDGDCNRCHTAHRNAASPGRIWLLEGHAP